MDLRDGVLERLALDIFLDRPVLDLLLQDDELSLQERPGEVGEIAPGIKSVPIGAGFVLALIVLPALLRWWRCLGRRSPSCSARF
jgi:hypothetical protein